MNTSLSNKDKEGCCSELESMLAKFWWESKEGERKIHWLSWERLAKLKSGGGMGFRGISDFNKASLGYFIGF